MPATAPPRSIGRRRDRARARPAGRVRAPARVSTSVAILRMPRTRALRPPQGWRTKREILRSTGGRSARYRAWHSEVGCLGGWPPSAMTPRQRHRLDLTCEDDGTQWNPVVLRRTHWYAPSLRSACPVVSPELNALQLPHAAKIGTEAARSVDR